MHQVFLILLLSLTVLKMGFGQDFDSLKLDHYFTTLEENQKFMGCVAVSKNGDIIYTQAIGYADVENGIKNTHETKFKIGSISKTFTAVLVFKAIENNLLALNQSIDTWFPTLPHAEKITINQLLYHRSGIHNFTDDSDYLTWYTQPKTEKEMLEIIKKGGSDFEPDSQASYSNSNYVLLTYILQKTFGKPYADLIQEHIAKPIGLNNTYTFGPITTNQKESKSYRYLGDWKLQPETAYTIPLGAGGVLSTATDLIRFNEALYGGELLSQESLASMKTMQHGYGMGLFQIPFYEHVGYGHTGGIDGFSSVMAYFEEDSIAYALIGNGVNMNPNDISITLLSAVYGKPYEIPTYTTIEVKSEDLDLYVGQYTSEQINLPITISKDKNILKAQALGQPEFLLEAFEKDKFKFEQAGVVLEFDPAIGTMKLKQGGGEFVYHKINGEIYKK